MCVIKLQLQGRLIELLLLLRYKQNKIERKKILRMNEYEFMVQMRPNFKPKYFTNPFTCVYLCALALLRLIKRKIYRVVNPFKT